MTKEITEANFVNLANSCVGVGLLKAGELNYGLAKELAKQEAIAFAEWVGKNDYLFWGGENNTWYHSDDRKRKNPLTTEQLYQLFLNQSKQQ